MLRISKLTDYATVILGSLATAPETQRTAADLAATTPFIAGSVLAALALGLAGSVAFARRLRQQTFDLGPGEIATLLEEIEARREVEARRPS